MHNIAPSRPLGFNKSVAPATMLIAATLLLSACASTPRYSQESLPPAVQVPAGHSVAMQTVGKGIITYECKPKKDTAGQFEWSFVGPEAALSERSGKPVGRYFGPPATWENQDGSKVTGAQVAVAPASAGNIPYQLVKANPASGDGAMRGISYIQRVATNGGVAPKSPCAATNGGAKETVNYQADYIFWKPA